MKKLFIFDLDGTLGWKKPSWPEISKENVNFLKELSSSNENLLFFATGRPRSQVFLAFENAGISRKKLYDIFPGGVYEDGLFVESKDKILFNALEEASRLFIKIKTSFFSSKAKEFFKHHRFLLFPGFIIKGNKSPYAILDYNEKETQAKLEANNIIPLYQQGNDIRETYKLPQGFLEDDMDKQKPIFDKIGNLTKEYLDSEFPGWEKTVKLEKWKDSVEIYPILNGKHFMKGEGISKLIPEIDKDIKIYICCDGRNDITLVDYIAKKYKNYHVICPSNVSIELKEALKQRNYNHTILEQDCSRIVEGIKNLFL